MHWDQLAAAQDGVLSRAQLRGLGLDRHRVRTQVRARQWCTPSPHTVAVFTGGLTPRQVWWVALLETGCSDAALDGVTALQAAGLTGFEAPVTVSCPRGARPRTVAVAHVHVSRWRRSGDVVTAGIPRVRPAAAAVHASLWAPSNRQAALIAVLAVQQRLTTPRRLGWELAQIRRHPRRKLLLRIVEDSADGAQALGELDFGLLCRRHGLPRPNAR